MEEIIGSNKYFLEEPYFIYDFFFSKQARGDRVRLEKM